MADNAKKISDVDTSEVRSKIKGWGADLDFSKRPAAIREARPASRSDVYQREIERQVPRVKILKSIEHKELTPVFGTACPPRGLSGALRTLAYGRYSEGQLAHWLILMAADRVDVVESSIRDLFRGRLDNPIAEMGLKAELKRHGLRSRVGQHRADVGSRFPKEFLLVAGLAAIVPTINFLGRKRQSDVEKAA
jgi:hypothetical protein